MAALTIAQMQTVLDGLSITGVNITGINPPETLNEWPVRFLRMPSLQGNRETFSGRGLRIGTMEFVILVGPITNSTFESEYASAVSYADLLAAAIEDFASSAYVDNYEITIQPDGPEETWWAVVALIEMSS